MIGAHEAACLYGADKPIRPQLLALPKRTPASGCLRKPYERFSPTVFARDYSELRGRYLRRLCRGHCCGDLCCAASIQRRGARLLGGPTVRTTPFKNPLSGGGCKRLIRRGGRRTSQPFEKQRIAVAARHQAQPAFLAYLYASCSTSTQSDGRAGLRAMRANSVFTLSGGHPNFSVPLRMK